MLPNERLGRRQFRLAEAIAWVSLFALGLGGFRCQMHPLSMVVMGLLMGWALAVAFACRRHVILFAAIGAFLFPIVSVPFWMMPWIESRFAGPVHTFAIENSPGFLPDPLALEKAREVMTRDGFDLEEWEPMEDHRSQSPDGVADKYLCRSVFNPNDGRIQFVNRRTQHSRRVDLELQGNVLTVRGWRDP